MKIHEENLKQTRRDRPVCLKKYGNYSKCDFPNFCLFQWPKKIVSVLVTWMIVDYQFGCQSCSVVLVVRCRSIQKCPIFCSFADTEFRSDEIRKF